MSEPEPDEVLYARYSVDDYEEDAEVLYRRGHDYFLARGSQCSCCGLRDQWEPIQYDAATLEAFLEGRA
jgi:hypothetical protein